MTAMASTSLPALAQMPRQSILGRVETEQRRRSFSRFFAAHPPKPNYIYGAHTRALIGELDKTTKELQQGRCRYLLFCLPFRQGKSDVASRRWPAWHILNCPSHEFMLCSYGYNLASSMSYDVRTLLREVGIDYGIRLKADREALGSYAVAYHGGQIHATGIRGTITGKGADVLLIDDYFKNREEAESETISEKVWESFESDLISRLAPVHAVVIVANRWREDDLVGRIKAKNDPGSPSYDPDFFPFEEVVFPIYDEATDTYLFEERFGRKWYINLRAAMGSYAWAAQGMQEPTPRGGNRFDPRRIVVHNSLDDFPQNLQWVRAWDLASSEKERNKTDPDSTAGCLAAVQQDPSNRLLIHLWVKDIRHGQWEAPQRDAIIQETAEADGPETWQGVESVAGYKDAYVTLRRVLEGYTTVRKIVPKGDKTVQASVLEGPCEAGAIHILRAGWNRPLCDQVRSFPNGKHDDVFNAMWLAYTLARKRGRFADISGFSRTGLGL